MNRNLDVLSAMNDARESGGPDEYYRLLPDLQIPAASLIAIKNTPGMGTALIRRLRMNTSLADARYGPGWLDRDGWSDPLNWRISPARAVRGQGIWSVVGLECLGKGRGQVRSRPRAGTNRLICEALGIPKRGHLKRKTLGLEPLSDAAALRLVKVLFDQVVEGPRTVVKRG